MRYVENGERRERQRSLGPAHSGRGRPRYGAIPEHVARARADGATAKLERELGYDVTQREVRATTTFSNLAVAWFEDAGRSTGRPWTPATERGYRSDLGQTKTGGKGHILPVLGDLGLGDLTIRRLRAWWDGLSDLTARNANRQLTVVRRVIAWSNEDGRWARVEDPAIGIRRRADERVQGDAPAFFEPAELQRIYSAARDLHDREAANPVRLGHDHVSHFDADVFELLAQSGIRRGEVIALNVGDVDLDPAAPTVTGEDSTPKGKRARRIPLTDRAVEILRPLVDGRADDQLVFSRGGGGGLDPDALSRRFLRPAMALG